MFQGQILCRSPLPTLDVALVELLAEEIRQNMINTSITHVISSMTTLATGTKKSTDVKIISTPSLKIPSSSSSTSSKFSTRRKNLKEVQCNYCRLYGHVTRDC